MTAPVGRPARTSVAAHLMLGMVRGSLLAAHAAWLAALAVGWFWAGWTGVGNAALGGALVVAFYAAGQGVLVLAGELDPRAGMGVTLLSYGVRAALLGLALLLASRSGEFARFFRPGPFFVGMVLVLVGWLAGMFVVHGRARVPTYDSSPRR